MKNILLSIDFSQNAYNAAIYAAELASHTGARLILFHAYNPVVVTNDEELKEDLLNSERNVQDKLDSLARKLQSLTNSSITRLLKPGNIVAETLYVAKKIKADLVIIGIPETTQEHYPVLDEVTAEMLEKSTLPVLLVPPKAVFRSYEQVYLASEGPGAVHDLINLKFLNKIFNRFRGVQLVKYQDLQQENSLEINNKPALANGTSIKPAPDKSGASDLARQQSLPAQLWVYAYAAVAAYKECLLKKAIAFTEAIPVLLLPISKA